MTLGLGNVKRLMEELDHPEREFRSVIVAGTNGKGSVSACISSILNENGVTVGRFISPHIYSVTERVAVNETPVTLEEMERAASRVRPLYEKIQFSYFEGLTAIAFLLFAEMGVDVAVLEVGLGGRFDATNVAVPVATVVTNIALDHRRILGSTVEEILREKLGVTRRNVPLFCGALSEHLMALVEEKSNRDGFPVYTLEKIGSVEPGKMDLEFMEAGIHTAQRDYGVMRLPFIGRHQMVNALLAVGVAELILKTVDHLGRAFKNAYLPGRFEVLSLNRKRIVMDVAHNDDALVTTAETFSHLSPPERNAIVFGLMRRKELDRFPSVVESAAKRLYLVGLSESEAGHTSEACHAADLLAKFDVKRLQSSGLDVIVSDNAFVNGGGIRFVEGLFHPSQPFDTILVTGSHKTVEFFGRQLARAGLL
jgi:dihydrofolate synthase/folylpolyglutamate synthase